MTRRLAIIPARGGSKRIPRKNVREFCGQPMIAYTLETARQSGLFETIHVSTEDEEVRTTVEGLGFTIDFPRPAHLSDDFTPIMPVMKYVTDTYAGRGHAFDEVWLLMACAPFIELNDLREAAALFQRAGGRRPVLAVTPYPSPIEWAYARSDDGALTPLQPGKFAIRSQDLEPRFFNTGTFAVFASAAVRESEGPGSDRNFVGYVIGKDRAIDVDDEDDWKLAELIYQARRMRDSVS
jgi:pseudaminic acid cytidylyltransferase